jgi:hypothetical protein
VYEHRKQPLLSNARFFRRLARHGAVAAALIAVSIAIGVVGFHACGGQDWLDAFVNTSMLLGGMGEVGEIVSTGGKWFSAVFALYAGLVFIAVSSILFAPVIHRVLHGLHADED